MDAHDIHPVDIVYIPHTHTRIAYPGRLCVWLLLVYPLLGFLPSDDISHTGGAHEVCPRISSGIIVLKSVVSDAGKHKSCFLVCFPGGC